MSQQHAMGVVSLIRAIDQGALTTQAVLEKVFANIDRFESTTQAYLSLAQRSVLLEAAAGFDKQRRKTGKAPHGVPLAIKDNIAIRGMPLSAGSRVLEGFVSPYDATCIERLKDAGFLFVGKANLDEWAFGSSTEFSGYHITRNPLDSERVPGGSSGGSVAAVSYGGAAAALGSDTGGSIRLPAAFCGLYALKPTYGSVSRFGLIAFASSLDQIGPVGCSIEDVQAVLHVIRGKDPRDETTQNLDFQVERELNPIVLGVPEPLEPFLSGCDDTVRRGYESFLAFAQSQPHVRVVPVDLRPLDIALPIYYIIAPAEASSNLCRYDGVRYGKRLGQDSFQRMYEASRALLGSEAQLRILMGTFSLSAGYQEAYYQHATKLRNQLRAWMKKQLECCHAIAIPTAPTVAFKLGEKCKDPVAMYQSDLYTVAVNLAGLPALSCPHYPSGSKLPMGIQFIGEHAGDDQLCHVASSLASFFEVRKLSGEA